MKWPLPAVLLATLLLTGGLWWRDRSAPESEPEPIDSPLARSGSVIGIAPSPTELPGPSQQAPTPSQAAQVDVFPSQSWEPPPPPVPASAEPPLPPPHLRPSPPTPFRVISLWWDQNDFYVVLDANGEEFPLCAKCRDMNFQTIGATLVSNYRVESIRPDGIDIVYLPNGKEERIALPGVASAGEPQ